MSPGRGWGWFKTIHKHLPIAPGRESSLSKFLLLIAFVLFKIQLRCLHLEMRKRQKASTYLFCFSLALEKQDTQKGFVSPLNPYILAFWHKLHLASITWLLGAKRNFPQNTVESRLTLRPLLLLHTQSSTAGVGGDIRNVYQIYIKKKKLMGRIPRLPRPD